MVCSGQRFVRDALGEEKTIQLVDCLVRLGKELITTNKNPVCYPDRDSSSVRTHRQATAAIDGKGVINAG